MFSNFHQNGGIAVSPLSVSRRTVDQRIRLAELSENQNNSIDGVRVLQEGCAFLHVGVPKHPPLLGEVLSWQVSLADSPIGVTFNINYKFTLFEEHSSNSMHSTMNFIERLFLVRETSHPYPTNVNSFPCHCDRIYSFELIFWAWNRLLDCRVALQGRLMPWLGKCSRDSCRNNRRRIRGY